MRKYPIVAGQSAVCIVSTNALAVCPAPPTAANPAISIPSAAANRPPSLSADGAASLRELDILGNLTPADVAAPPPSVASVPEATAWLNEQMLMPLIDEVRADRLAEVDRVATHVELSLTEVLQRIDEEIGRAAEEVEKGTAGAEGRLAQAESRHADVLARVREFTDLTHVPVAEPIDD